MSPERKQTVNRGACSPCYSLCCSGSAVPVLPCRPPQDDTESSIWYADDAMYIGILAFAPPGTLRATLASSRQVRARRASATVPTVAVASVATCPTKGPSAITHIVIADEAAITRLAARSTAPATGVGINPMARHVDVWHRREVAGWPAAH